MIDSLNHALLIQNKQLQDSVKHLSEKLHQEPISGLDVLNNVNTFYDSSWNKLIWVVGALLAVIGVIIPLVIQYWQNKKVKTSENLLREEIKLAVNGAKYEIGTEISKVIDLLKTDINTGIADSVLLAKVEINTLIESAKTEMLDTAKNEIESEIKDLKARFEEIQNTLFGRTLQLQARSLYETHPTNAFVSYLLAIKKYSRSSEVSMGNKLLNFLITDYFPRKISKELLEAELKKSKIEFDDFIEIVRRNDKKKILKESLDNFVVHYKNQPAE